jgi:hypothetical protein
MAHCIFLIPGLGRYGRSSMVNETMIMGKSAF